MFSNEGQDTRLLANVQVLNANAQRTDSVLQGTPLTKRVCPGVSSLFGSEYQFHVGSFWEHWQLLI
jgi:hypothetical protein